MEYQKETYQQGDVTFRRVGDAMSPEQLTDCPGWKVRDKGRRHIVAVGEGHHVHVVEAPTETDAELIQAGERMLLNIRIPVEVQHEHTTGGLSGDHGTGGLAPGLWEVGNVREVDHFAQQERRVMD